MTEASGHRRPARASRTSPATPAIDTVALARACQHVSAQTTADAVLEAAARAALELTGATTCVASTIHADASPWLTIHVARQAGELVRIASAPAPLTDAVQLALCIEGARRGAMAIAGATAPGQLAAGLAPLLRQLEIGLKHALRYGELEKLVVREIQTTSEREHAMQLVLDSMHDGVLVCELDGRASAIRSRSVTQVFGEPGDLPVWAYLAGGDAKISLRFEIGWIQAAGDDLPFEVATSVMPSELRHREQIYRLNYHRVERDGVLAQIAISLHDITEELAGRLAHEQSHELAAVVRSLMADREGFFGFLGDVDRLLVELGAGLGAGAAPSSSPGSRRGSSIAAGGADAERARALHTLKGNTAMFGFEQFAAECHALENELADGGGLDAARLDVLRDSWLRSLAVVRPFLDGRAHDDVAVTRDELAAQIQRMRAAGVAAELLAELERWRIDPIGPALERLGSQAELLARAQGKDVQITIEGARARFTDDRIRRLLAPLIHAVRNAIDHGLELPAERLEAGKPAVGQLVLACRDERAELVVEVIDDGRGVSWERVRNKARTLGLPADTTADLVEVLFADGVTTASEISELSGRGIGMSALREVCRELGGTVHVESSPGQGTRLTCRIPR